MCCNQRVPVGYPYIVNLGHVVVVGGCGCSGGGGCGVGGVDGGSGGCGCGGGGGGGGGGDVAGFGHDVILNDVTLEKSRLLCRFVSACLAKSCGVICNCI